MSHIYKKLLCLCGGALSIALLAGVFTTWPLALHMDKGISALHRAETGSLRISMPGDHLQLMYFFQLTRDFVAGNTPWFYNLYEFNAGDDAARYELDFYYMPFSLVFAAIELITGNPALAWNLTGFFSLWLGALGILLLARRFTLDRWVILAATLAGTIFPYRLITFLHGSPTGFGISYVPFMLLGLDYAIRDKKAWGGILAGAFFFFAEGVDLHTYFFLGLVTPFWCIFVYLHEGASFDWRRVRKTAIALIPFVLFICLAIARIWVIRMGLKDSVMAGGRNVTEVAQFSPVPSAYWALNPDHPSSYVYLTFMIPVMILLGLWHAVWDLRRAYTPRTRNRFWLLVGLLAGVGVILLLGLGPRMPLPRSDRLWELFVRLVPPYSMIRQPPKVLVLLPSLLAVLVAMPFAGKPCKGPLYGRSGLYGICSVLLLCEVAWRIEPAISLLDQEQGAYAAVAANAERHGEVPRAISIALWPGDTHWTSLNQYYGMKYRIRMLNGYRPRVPAAYFTDVFMRFVSLNRGYASDAQLDALLEMGIRHIIVHEDAFPEQVSPFGVAQTLAGFLRHPRIRFLQQDRAVWAFEIMEGPAVEHAREVLWETASVTYWWDAERHAKTGTEVLADENAHGGHFVRLLPHEGSSVALPIWGIHHVEGLRLSVRIRGRGLLQARIALDGEMHEELIDTAGADDGWEWYNIPFPAFTGFHSGLAFELAVLDGALDVDYAYIAQGITPDQMEVGDVFAIPAPTLFRAGYTDLAADEVVLTPALVPAATILYGPRLPLPRGRYNIRLRYRAETDGEVGSLGFRYPLPEENPETATVMGHDTVVEMAYVNRQNLPFTVAFFYNRSGQVAIQSLEIERLE